MKVIQTQDLTSEGKSYDLFYDGTHVGNVTLESGEEMTGFKAYLILCDLLVRSGHKRLRNTEKVMAKITYKESD